MKLAELQAILPIKEMAELSPDKFYLVSLREKVTMDSCQSIAGNLNGVGLRNIVVDGDAVRFHELKMGAKYLVVIQKPIPQAQLIKWEAMLREKAKLDVVFVDKAVQFFEESKHMGDLLHAANALCDAVEDAGPVADLIAKVRSFIK